MGINIFMLDPMAVSISWWSRPLKVVVYVVFIFLTTSTTALWWCASWWGFFSSQGGRGDPFSEKSQKKLVKSICTSFHTYISMGRKSKKVQAKKSPKRNQSISRKFVFWYFLLNSEMSKIHEKFVKLKGFFGQTYYCYGLLLTWSCLVAALKKEQLRLLFETEMTTTD